MGALSLDAIAGKINREHEAALLDAKSAVEHARAAGRLLLEAKERCPNGEWGKWLSANCNDISVRTAQRYMVIVRNPEIKAESVREAILKISSPKKSKTTRVSPSQVTDSEQKEDSRSATVQVSIESTSPPSDPPVIPPDSAHGDDSGDGSEPDGDESERIASMEREYLASIEKVMDADDKLAAAHSEIKRQAAEITSLKQSRDGWMHKCSVLQKRVNALQAQADRHARAAKKK